MVKTKNGSMEGRPQTRLDKLAQKLYDSVKPMSGNTKLSWYIVSHNTKCKYRRLAWERLNEVVGE